MRQGISFVEIIIYLAIVFIIITSLILMIVRLLKNSIDQFFAHQLTQEVIFLKKKIEYFLNYSSAFRIITSTGYFRLEFISNPPLPNLVLERGRLFLQRGSDNTYISSQYFNYTSSSLIGLGNINQDGSYRGIKLVLVGKVNDDLKIRAIPFSVEIVHYSKND
ncbi:MAG: hypothetical protein NZ822_03195 [Patescibacteria group bacterium]|nr:hypothetical protein [Patescibacteria group bacterium]